MIQPIRAWNRFWFAPISARPLGAFRILFGVCCLLNLLLLANDPDEWLSDAGYLRGWEAKELAGTLRFSLLHLAASPLAVRVFLAATATVTVLFTLGWRTRLMGVLLYVCNLSIQHRNLLTCSGADALWMCISFYLMLSPCGAAYSLDARRAARKRGTDAEPLIVPWAQRLIQIQVSVLYFITALSKAGGVSWREGTALYYVLNDSEFRRFTFGLTEWPILIHLLTSGALFIEFALAFWLWFRPTRPFAIFSGILLHVGIMFTVNIPIFGELLIASYLTFLTPQEFDGLIRFLIPWRKARKSALVLNGRIDPGGGLPRGAHSGPRAPGATQSARSRGLHHLDAATDRAPD